MFKKNQKNIKVLGMMSGTSGDGIDGALVEFAADGGFSLLWHDSMSFKDGVRKRIHGLMKSLSGEEVVLGNSYVAQLYAEACNAFLGRNEQAPDYIAAHGQTVFHTPELSNWDGYMVNGSLQLMNGSVLALKTGIPVVCNFREADMAAEGEGAPLVPFADACFFGRELEQDRIILNVGGISNITVLKKAQGSAMISAAFDTGPGNMLMDACCVQESEGKKHFDKNGEIAAQAEPDLGIVAEFLKDPYFSRKPPKSTGREKFGEHCLCTLIERFSKDATLSVKLSTLLEITVQSIVDAVLDPELKISFPAQLIVAGGGALNSELMRRLSRKLNERCEVFCSDQFAVPVMAREAMAFAALGNAFLRRQAANVPIATGAKNPVILGQYHPGI